MADLGEETKGTGVYGGVEYNGGTGYNGANGYNGGTGYGDEGTNNTWGSNGQVGNTSEGYDGSKTTWGNNAQGYTGAGYGGQTYYNQASSYDGTNGGQDGSSYNGYGYSTGKVGTNSTSKELTNRGLWSKFKAFWLQKIDWNTEIRVELTPYQQKIEDEINEFLHQEITWEKVHNFLFQEVKFK